MEQQISLSVFVSDVKGYNPLFISPPRGEMEKMSLSHSLPRGEIEEMPNADRLLFCYISHYVWLFHAR